MRIRNRALCMLCTVALMLSIPVGAFAEPAASANSMNMSVKNTIIERKGAVENASSTSSYVYSELDANKENAPTSAPKPGNTMFSNWTDIVSLKSGSDFIAGLKSDGTVLIKASDWANSSYELDVSSWQDIKKISADGFALMGLKEDGTVVVTGEDSGLLAELSKWRNIVDISTSGVHAVGVREDGRLEYAGLCNEEKEKEQYLAWRDVKSAKAIVCSASCITLGFSKDGKLLNDGHCYLDVSSSGWLTTGIRADGSVYFWGIDAATLQAEMLLWKNIKQVCPGDVGAVGLQTNGQLVFAGFGHKFEEAASWTDIKQIIEIDDALYYDGENGSFIIGLKEDGTVAVTGNYLVDTSDWRDIVDVKAFENNLVGLKEDGTIVSAEWSDTLNPAFEENLKIDFEELQRRLLLFDNGWLTFAYGGSMYVPENFMRSQATDSDSEFGRTYHFLDSKTSMAMQVSEAYLDSYPDVESSYSDGVTEYYVNRNGKKMDFIIAKYAELSETYKDVEYIHKDDTACEFRGQSGSESFCIRYEVQNDIVYCVNIRYPLTQADTCERVLKDIEENFLK